MRRDTEAKIADARNCTLTASFVAVSDRITLEVALLSANARSRLCAAAGGTRHKLANSARYFSLD